VPCWQECEVTSEPEGSPTRAADNKRTTESGEKNVAACTRGYREVPTPCPREVRTCGPKPATWKHRRKASNPSAPIVTVVKRNLHPRPSPARNHGRCLRLRAPRLRRCPYPHQARHREDRAEVRRRGSRCFERPRSGLRALPRWHRRIRLLQGHRRDPGAAVRRRCVHPLPVMMRIAASFCGAPSLLCVEWRVCPT